MSAFVITKLLYRHEDADEHRGRVEREWSWASHGELPRTNRRFSLPSVVCIGVVGRSRRPGRCHRVAYASASLGPLRRDACIFGSRARAVKQALRVSLSTAPYLVPATLR